MSLMYNSSVQNIRTSLTQHYVGWPMQPNANRIGEFLLAASGSKHGLRGVPNLLETKASWALSCSSPCKSVVLLFNGGTTFCLTLAFWWSADTAAAYQSTISSAFDESIKEEDTFSALIRPSCQHSSCSQWFIWIWLTLSSNHRANTCQLFFFSLLCVWSFLSHYLLGMTLLNWYPISLWI